MPYVTPAEVGAVVTPTKVIYEELRIKTIDVGYSRPGILVKRDTDDSHVQALGSGEAGCIGFLAKDPKLSVTTDFTAEDWVRVGHGPGAVVALAFDVTVASVTKGDALYAGLHGKVVKAGGTDITKIVGWAEASKAASGVLLVRLAK